MKRRTIIGGATAAGASAILATVLFLTSSTPLPPATATVLGPQAPIGTTYFDNTQVARGKIHGAQCASADLASNEFVLLNYYDLPLTMYGAYQRTGDSDFLNYARTCADQWWKHPTWIGSGTIRQWPDSAAPAPRHAGVGGLIVRALDGRPELWPWIVDYTQFSLDLWVKRRVADPQLYYGLREGAFSLQYAAWVAKVLPDTYPNAAAIRAQLTTDIDNVAVNYFGRLQQPDGSWRWDDFDSVDADGGTLKGVMQPFMVGLLLSALTDVHQLTTNPTVKANVANQILKGTRHLYSDGPYIKDQVELVSGKRVRGFHYMYHGGTSVNPTRYAKGDIPNPWTAAEAWYVPSARQAISTILPAYAYAFSISGDPYYKAAYDEMWDAAYGSDGFRAMLEDTAKNYNQHMRGVPKGLVWIGGAVASPSPTTSSTATPVTESPNNTRLPPVAQVITSTSEVWTRKPDGTILRNGGPTSGTGSQVLYCNHVVYVFGTDSQWYKWSGGWGAVGVVDPCGGATPTPTPSTTLTPTPVPLPSPTPTPTPQPTATPVVPCATTSWPSSVAGQNSQMQTRRAQGCYPVRRTNSGMEYVRP